MFDVYQTWLMIFYLGADIEKGQDSDPFSVLRVSSEIGKIEYMLIITKLASVNDNFAGWFV